MAARTKGRLSDVKTKGKLSLVQEDDDCPKVSDGMWGDTPFPSWVQGFRPHQWQAVQEIMEAYENGADVVFLDAPTGSGKTLIAEMVRRLMDREKNLYVCSGKDLQDQFLKDFDYARVLKGRANYPTLDKPFPMVNCGDCDKTGKGEEAECSWCSAPQRCPYTIAKEDAIRAEVAVVNTSYFLAEANWVGTFTGQELVILDECDVLEGELMNFVEFKVTERMCRDLNITPPKKGVHKETIAKWITDVLEPGIKTAIQNVSREPLDHIERIRKKNSLMRKLQECEGITDEILDDNWIRDNDAGPLVLKPVQVHDYGRQVLWTHGQKWLLMSATIISSDEMAQSLGITSTNNGTDEEVEPLSYATVHVPMTFPVEHRRIVASNVGSMSRKNLDATFPRMVDSVVSIVNRHPDDNVLIHTHSYALNASLSDALRQANILRPIITYGRASDRDLALSKFRSTPRSVLLAPSMDRGIDLAGDTCRVMLIVKVPFPYLGDKQVSARLHLPGGQTWYNVQTVRTIVQMTGRGVRSRQDWATTYILDGEFMKFWSKGKALLPEWWKESVTVISPKQLLDGRYEVSGP